MFFSNSRRKKKSQEIASPRERRECAAERCFDALLAVLCARRIQPSLRKLCIGIFQYSSRFPCISWPSARSTRVTKHEKKNVRQLKRSTLHAHAAHFFVSEICFVFLLICHANFNSKHSFHSQSVYRQRSW